MKRQKYDVNWWMNTGVEWLNLNCCAKNLKELLIQNAYL